MEKIAEIKIWVEEARQMFLAEYPDADIKDTEVQILSPKKWKDLWGEKHGYNRVSAEVQFEAIPYIVVQQKIVYGRKDLYRTLLHEFAHIYVVDKEQQQEGDPFSICRMGKDPDIYCQKGYMLWKEFVAHGLMWGITVRYPELLSGREDYELMGLWNLILNQDALLGDIGMYFATKLLCPMPLDKAKLYTVENLRKYNTSERLKHDQQVLKQIEMLLSEQVQQRAFFLTNKLWMRKLGKLAVHLSDIGRYAWKEGEMEALDDEEVLQELRDWMLEERGEDALNYAIDELLQMQSAGYSQEEIAREFMKYIK